MAVPYKDMYFFALLFISLGRKSPFLVIWKALYLPTRGPDVGRKFARGRPDNCSSHILQQ